VPVVVTGASGFIGRRAVAAFAGTSPEVRAYVRRRDGAGELQSIGAKVASGSIFDVDTLEAVMRDAHTVCHLVGGLFLPDEGAYREANLGSVQAVLEAASRAEVRRILFLSSPSASGEATNAYLRFKGMAEDAVRGSGLEHVIVRTTHVYGPGGQWLEIIRSLAMRWPPVVVGSGRQIVAPVLVDDVAAVLAAADDRRRVRSGTWGLEGPDRLSAVRLAELFSGGRRLRLHLPPASGARLARLTGTSSRTALELLASDCVADEPDAAAEFGVVRTQLSEGLARSGVTRGPVAEPE